MKPKSQPVIYYLKIIYKMFALFEGISNKLLVSFFSPPLLLIHETDDSH